MVIRNHIAFRMLTDDGFWMEILESWHPNEMKAFANGSIKELPGEIHSLYNLVNANNQKPYLVTESVLENLSMLKVQKKDNHFDWTVFKHLPDQKVTFILPNNKALRMIIIEDRIHFFYTVFEFRDKVKGTGWMNNVIFYLNRESGELCEHFKHKDVVEIEEMVYKFLCFFYLTDNDEQIIAPGQVHGTRKSGKVMNDFKFPLTMVTSRWNTTTIRTEKFGVRGHFRLQPCGSGRMSREIIFIEPFEKKGYVRKAGKLL